MEIKTLTLAAFAELRSEWPEGLDSPSKGTLIARIHPECNRSQGDETVLARALVYSGGELRRLTIRRGNVESEDCEDGSTFLHDYAKMYRECLYAVMKLPIIELA
jgi:hypothetical protein